MLDVQGGGSIVMRVDGERPSRPSSAEHHHAVAQPPSVIMNSDMEAFGNRLNAIVNADFYAAALAVGPVDVPLGELNWSPPEARLSVGLQSTQLDCLFCPQA